MEKIPWRKRTIAKNAGITRKIRDKGIIYSKGRRCLSVGALTSRIAIIKKIKAAAIPVPTASKVVLPGDTVIISAYREALIIANNTVLFFMASLLMSHMMNYCLHNHPARIHPWNTINAVLNIQ
jgi:hypothetical protein